VRASERRESERRESERRESERKEPEERESVCVGERGREREGERARLSYGLKKKSSSYSGRGNILRH